MNANKTDNNTKYSRKKDQTGNISMFIFIFFIAYRKFSLLTNGNEIKNAFSRIIKKMKNFKTEGNIMEHYIGRNLVFHLNI